MAGSIEELAKYRYERGIEELQNAMEMREHADYEDFFVASRKDAEQQVGRAEEFLDYVKVYLEEKQVLEQNPQNRGNLFRCQSWIKMLQLYFLVYTITQL